MLLDIAGRRRGQVKQHIFGKRERCFCEWLVGIDVLYIDGAAGAAVHCCTSGTWGARGCCTLNKGGARYLHIGGRGGGDQFLTLIKKFKSNPLLL